MHSSSATDRTDDDPSGSPHRSGHQRESPCHDRSPSARRLESDQQLQQQQPNAWQQLWASPAFISETPPTGNLGVRQPLTADRAGSVSLDDSGEWSVCAREDCTVGVCGGRQHPLPPLRDFPLLKSLLLPNNGSSVSGTVFVEPARRNLVLPASERVAIAAGSSSPSAPLPDAAASPGAHAEAKRMRSTVVPLRRQLDALDIEEIRKMTRLFQLATRVPPCCRQQVPPASHVACVDSMDHLVLHIKAAVLSLLHFCCQLPEFRRKPPYVQLALVKAVSAESLVLRAAEYYDCSRGCWLNAHSSSFGPHDLARLMPSAAAPELWHDIAALSASLRSLLLLGGDGGRHWSPSFDRGDSDAVVADDVSMSSSFALLQAVLVMSPESVPYRRERDREIAADVSDFQQACILLLRHHLEASLSVAHAAQLLPTLLERLQTVRNLASGVRTALLSEQAVRRDLVLVDALTQPMGSNPSRSRPA